MVQGTASGTCSITITSNSYGEGEEYQYFEGSPMYISAEDQELELLNAVGVTNFFAFRRRWRHLRDRERLRRGELTGRRRRSGARK